MAAGKGDGVVVAGLNADNAEVSSKSDASESSEPEHSRDDNVSIDPEAALANTALADETPSGSETDPFSVRPPKHTGGTGLVTTLENFDYPVVEAAMKSEPAPIRTAGIFPPGPIVERFAQYFPPGTPFSFVLLRLHELSQMHTRFHLCGLKDHLWVADLIEPVRNLTVGDRIIFCACPASKQDVDLFKALLPALARCVDRQGGGSLLDIMEMPLEVLEKGLSPSRHYLRELERLHKGLIAYLWLSYRFAGIFTSRPLAFHVKGLVEEKIERVLSGFTFTDKERKANQARREKSIMDSLRLEQETGSTGDQTTDLQTSVVAGGDHFSGEVDIELTEPIEEGGADELTAQDQRHDLPPKTVADTGEAFATGTDTAENRVDTTEALASDEVFVTDDANQVRHDSQDQVAVHQAPDVEAGISPMEPEVSSDGGIRTETESETKPLETQMAPPKHLPSTAANV